MLGRILVDDGLHHGQCGTGWDTVGQELLDRHGIVRFVERRVMDLIDASVECHVCRLVRCRVADGKFAVPIRRYDESVQGCLTEGWASGVLGEELYPVCAACDDRLHVFRNLLRRGNQTYGREARQQRMWAVGSRGRIGCEAKVCQAGVVQQGGACLRLGGGLNKGGGDAKGGELAQATDTCRMAMGIN